MNPLDIALIIVLLIFLAVGARLGSVWTTACLAAGFLGATMADIYALPLADMMGTFAGAEWLAVFLIYVGTAIVVLIPGFLLSRITSAVFLGIIDSFCGMITGAFTGVLIITLLLLIVLPFFPRVEKNPMWKQSQIVRPFENFLDQQVQHSPFQTRWKARHLKDPLPDLEKSASKAMDTVEKKAKNVVRELKK